MVSKGQDLSNGLGIYPIEALLATTKAAFIAGASSSSAFFIDFFIAWVLWLWQSYKTPPCRAFIAFIAFMAFMAFIAFIACTGPFSSRGA